MYSASEIALALKLSEPTEEQVAIAEAPVNSASRVVAGAGSGKTETMALRVLWLVANGFINSELILGLTFTRKAKAELGSRIRLRLRGLAKLGILENGDDFGPSTVATYNSFAAKIYRDFAPLLGLDPDAQVLSEASAWAMTTRVVASSNLPNLEDLDLTLDSLAGMVRNLGFRMKENNVQTDILVQFVREFLETKELPNGGRGTYKKIDEWADRVAHLVPLARLVEELDAEKRRLGVVEFSDQVFLASQLAEQFPRVVEQTRSRHQVVLLDEYQDTSVLQARLLRTLFAGQSVMAVGDPTQAIYGWRGASGSNLNDFAADFGKFVNTFTLSTSWRNGKKILEAANLISAGLPQNQISAVQELKSSPNADSANLDFAFPESIEQEAEEVAVWLDEKLRESEHRASAAILLRNRANQKLFVDALVERGIPVNVLGIGGLLEDPAIVDLVCTLKVLASGAADSEFIRLLAGARWRLGVSDLWALRQTALWLRGRDHLGRPLAKSMKAGLHFSTRLVDKPSLFDAVSFLVEGKNFKSRWSNFSESAQTRIIEVYEIFQALTKMSLSDIESLVALIHQKLNLDIEVFANPLRADSAAALETFFSALRDYQGAANQASIEGFVGWLEDAEKRDNLSPRSESPETGSVQVLTIHGSKGLEWDFVAIPRLVSSELPSRSRNSLGWLRGGELPYHLRGDRSSLPEFRWREAKSRKELIDRQKFFSEAVKSHEQHEERRLMYVAMTRARSHLLLSGSFWGNNVSAQGPSIFLEELRESGLIGNFQAEPEGENPGKHDETKNQLWPRDPLGSRRAIVEKSAAAVLEAIKKQQPSSKDGLAAQLLRIEAAAKGHGLDTALTIPVRISASNLEKWFTAPREQAALTRRPIPKRKSTGASRGSAFHKYVENYYRLAAQGSLPGFDEQKDVEIHEISDLVKAFKASVFAGMKPLAIEQELHLPIAGHILVCKIDAVFQEAGAFHIVDWKTGAAPKNETELEAKALQLSAYRAAWSSWRKVNENLVKASFWFAGSSKLHTPSNLLRTRELEERLQELF